MFAVRVKSARLLLSSCAALLLVAPMAQAQAGGTSFINLTTVTPLACMINPSAQTLWIEPDAGAQVSATLTFKCNDYDGAKFFMYSSNGALINPDVAVNAAGRSIAYSAQLKEGTLPDIAIPVTAASAMKGEANAVTKVTTSNTVLASTSGGTGIVDIVVTETSAVRWAGNYSDTLNFRIDAVP